MALKRFALMLSVFMPLGFIHLAFAQESETKMRLETAPATSSPPLAPWNMSLSGELRSVQDLRDRPQNLSQQSLHELSVSGAYRFDPHFEALAELSIEQIQPESPASFFIKQGYLNWKNDYVALKVGQQFLPVGLILPRDNWFSSLPSYLQNLVGGLKPVDLGTTFTLQYDTDLYYIQGGLYAGQTLRAQDQKIGTAIHPPRILSLKSHSQWHDAFVTYYDHQLAFADPIQAWGLGFEVRSPEWHTLKGSLLSEFWSIDQIQSKGPTQRTKALTSVIQIDYWRLSAGVLYSEARLHIFSALNPNDPETEAARLYFTQVRLAQIAVLRFERALETQELTLRDDWATRLLMSWNF